MVRSCLATLARRFRRPATERRFRRKVAWGARCSDEEKVFTTISVPVMTRLRMQERSILDTLVAGGVARSRSDALAWCVRLVGMHQADWIKGLRDALARANELVSIMTTIVGNTRANAGLTPIRRNSYVKVIDTDS